ncbi:coiled-coil domain-containing protein 97 [Discoglossus pictus]
MLLKTGCRKMAAPHGGSVELWGYLEPRPKPEERKKEIYKDVEVPQKDPGEKTEDLVMEMTDNTTNKNNGEESEVVERALKVAMRLSSREDPRDQDPAQINGPLLEMFTVISSSCVPIRSQQKGDPEFSQEQKMSMLLELYESKPLVFLERFRKVLREEHLGCFNHLSGVYTADYYCKEIRKASLKRVDRTRVRNKRFAALQQLITAGEYFSDEQMRERDPLMYEQYVGQYQSEEEIMSQNSKDLSEAKSLSDVLLNSCQEQNLQRRLEAQREMEDNCMEEEEEEDEEEESELQSDEEHEVDNEERALMREELISRMHQRFLDGKDRNFDYSEVDNNPDFDNLDIVTHDEEEKYFDDDDDDYDDDEEEEEKEDMEANDGQMTNGHISDGKE